MTNGWAAKMDYPASDIQILPYRVADLADVQALHGRIGPYRPEDNAEVQAMVARAEAAERARDRWLPLAPAADSLDAIAASYLAFWVAVAAGHQGADQVVGMVGVRRCDVDRAELRGLALAQQWQQRSDVAELRRLRVAPEFARRGIGAQLSRTVIDWSRDNGFRSLILSTTAAQTPALALYRTLGFQEVGRSFFGTFELVWLELAL